MSTESLLGHNASICPSCGEHAPAIVIERHGKTFQRTRCDRHGVTENVLLSDSRLHHKLDAWNQRVFGTASALRPEALEDDDEGKAPLLAVIDLTNRCNFACPVCFAEVPQGDSYFLSLETVRRMLQVLAERRPLPCRHVQFSGGEPTLHPQFLDIVRMAREMGFSHIQVATNGSMFGSLDFTRRCEDAGLQTLYLQFDAMHDGVYHALRGRNLLESKLRAVGNLTRTNLRMVLVPTIVAGLNVDQLGPIFRFALEHSRHVTGISVQPMAATGRVGIPPSGGSPFNLADLALEFGHQTGLTRFPEDWFPLNALTLLTRGISRLRGQVQQNPACDAYCSVGTYFHVDEDNKPTCLTSFFDLERFLDAADALDVPEGAGALRRRISGLAQLSQLSGCFEAERAPRGLTFLRLLRGLDGWEDKTVGRGRWWFRRGFNGMFVAGMHFMDSANYDLRRVRRCIIKYVTTDGRLVSFCNYNAGDRHRTAEESARLGNQDPQPANGKHAVYGPDRDGRPASSGPQGPTA
jgi:7,8-dihydro-6-hydroxymethylpterin dimethyltransferase